MQTLFPEIEPYDHGMLDVGDAQNIRWMQSGNPNGVPVVILHGGPGSGSSAGTRRFFNPQHYRIIQFDQRGCGGSLPHASEPEADLCANTTWHLVDDIEQLRIFLGIECWLVYGNSWGCTLALVYAEAHPERVAALIVVGVTMTRQSEIDWLYEGLARFFPEEWQRFRAAVPESGRSVDLIAAYRHLLRNPDPAIHLKAAKDWHDWESASILVDPRAALSSRWSDPRYLIARARIITHYFHHRGWLEDLQILRDIHRLAGIACTMIQGRLDLEAPVVTAWELSRAWPAARLVIVPNCAHSPSTLEMAAAIIEATNEFRTIADGKKNQKIF
ncbi:prolyl aminopeptidase [Rhizobium calliandrae]|uniref:Proline iminopeptidase n=1 Tax=Rhizobium calliandrae TaxID=1312182 RepID=A0ABT7KFB5_9HYPH|nr:prolyl aminopeptidase [Rhizobium calliandrae]MDL2407308.1 prolyl aminopeptidase [Rhizobium calliandrae]